MSNDEQKPQKSQLISALCRAQREINPPGKDGTNPVFKSKYATLDALLNAVRIPLAKHGIALWRSVEIVEGRDFVKCSLIHDSGERLESFFPIIVEKPTPQGYGSAETYASRRAIAHAVGLPSDKDDDANLAERESGQIKRPERTLSEDEINFVKSSFAPDKIKTMVDFYGVSSISEIPASRFKKIQERATRETNAG